MKNYDAGNSVISKASLIARVEEIDGRPDGLHEIARERISVRTIRVHEAE